MFGLNKYVIYAIGVAIAVAVISTYILMWKHNIRQQALLEFNQKQMEQVIEDNKKFQKATEDLKNISNQILQSVEQTNKELQQKIDSVNEYLSSPEVTKENKSSSDILQETLRRLGAPSK